MKGEFDNRKNGLEKENGLSRREVIALGILSVVVAAAVALGGGKEEPLDLGTSPTQARQAELFNLGMGITW